MSENELLQSRHPVEYLKILFRRKWLFISPIFAGLVLGIIACFTLPPGYESSSVILVQEEKLINPLIQGLAISTNTVQRMETIREQLLGWNSLVALTKRLDLTKNIKTQAEFEKLILGLRKNIQVKMFGPMLIKISYYGNTPAQTQLIAKTLSDILIDENMRQQTKEASVAINFIKEQLDVYKRKIDESEVAELQEQLKALLVDSTEQHPLVKELRKKIESAKLKLGPGDHDYTTNEKPISPPSYEVIKKELDKLLAKDDSNLAASTAFASEASEGNDPNAAIYKLMLMDKFDSVLARDMRVNENIYNMLLQKLETAKITQRLEVSKEGTRYDVIDPARMPLNPVKPNKLKVIFLSLFLGTCSGVGLVFGREFMDQSFLDIQDAKLTLELPVLGAISRLTTQEEIDKEKLKKKKVITIAVSTSVVLIIIVMLIALLKR
ncbi:MAG: GNVR domain-containing protein [Candidatus Omnitrophota bacterium]